MRVLMVTPSYHPIIGGTETVVQNLFSKLNEIGVHTDVMTFNMNHKWTPIWEKKIEKIREADIIKIPALNIFAKAPINPLALLLNVNVFPQPRSARELRNYDIIHFHDVVDLSFPLFYYFQKKPKLFQCHTLFESFNYYKKNPLSKFLFRNVGDMYICLGKRSARLLAELGVSISKIRILYNGVDTEKFRPHKKEKIHNLVLFVGRLERRKGLHVLLRSLTYLDLPINLVIVGPVMHFEYFKEILILINEQNKKDLHKISFLGSVDQNALIKWYQKSSIFVCPSLIETFGVTNLEALSCETPVVATNVGDIPEIIHNYENGILVPPNNAIKLSHALRYLLENKEVRIKFGRKGRKRVIESFSWKVIAKALRGIYEEISMFKGH